MAALPPSDGQAAAKVGNKHANEGVDNKDVRNGSVAGVMGGKHDLMLFGISKVRLVIHTAQEQQRTQNRPRKTAEVMYHA